MSKGEIAYYAIVYEAPVLGALQRLRVSVSQMEAADQPATAGVGNATAPRSLNADSKFDSIKEYAMSAQADTTSNEFRGDQRLVIEETDEPSAESEEFVSDERRAELVDEGRHR